MSVELTSPPSAARLGWEPSIAYLIPAGSPPNVQVCQEVDSERFMSLLMDTLTA